MIEEKRRWQQRVGDALMDQQVPVQFGLLGSGNMAVVERLAAHGVRYVAARHESVAVSMADGWARVTGRPGLCSVTAGPGFTAALTGLVTAQRARSPVVLLAAETYRADGQYPAPFDRIQSLDQLRALDGMDIPAIRLGRNTAEEGIEAAFALAGAIDHPVVICSGKSTPPQDESERNLVWSQYVTRRDSDIAGSFPYPPGSDVVDTLRRASRTLVLGGRGARGCHDGLIELARRLDARLGTTLAAAGMFSDEPRNLGIIGGFSSPSAREWLRDVDCVVSVGASLNEFTLDRGRLFANHAQLVQCDHDAAAQHPWAQRAGHFLHGPAPSTVTRLLESIGPRDDSRGLMTVDDTSPPAKLHVDGGSTASRNGLDPAVVAATLDEHLPHPRRLVCDVGHFALFPPAHVATDTNSGVLFMHEFGAVGTGLGAAIGSAIAAEASPDDITTVLTIGDGGLQMTLGDLASLNQVTTPLLIVCFNDQGYGAEYHQLTTLQLPTGISALPNPGFAAVAEALGVPARTVTTLGGFEQALADFRTSPGLLLLDVTIDRSVKSPLLGPHDTNATAGTAGPAVDAQAGQPSHEESRP